MLGKSEWVDAAAHISISSPLFFFFLYSGRQNSKVCWLSRFWEDWMGFSRRVIHCRTLMLFSPGVSHGVLAQTHCLFLPVFSRTPSPGVCVSHSTGNWLFFFFSLLVLTVFWWSSGQWSSIQFGNLCVTNVRHFNHFGSLSVEVPSVTGSPTVC